MKEVYCLIEKRTEIKKNLSRKPLKIDDALRADAEQYPDDYQHERAGLHILVVGLPLLVMHSSV